MRQHHFLDAVGSGVLEGVVGDHLHAVWHDVGLVGAGGGQQGVGGGAHTDDFCLAVVGIVYQILALLSYVRPGVWVVDDRGFNRQELLVELVGLVGGFHVLAHADYDVLPAVFLGGDAVVECGLVEGRCYVGGVEELIAEEGEAMELGAESEGALADGGDLDGDDDVLEVCVLVEGVVSDLGERRGQQQELLADGPSRWAVDQCLLVL